MVAFSDRPIVFLYQEKRNCLITRLFDHLSLVAATSPHGRTASVFIQFLQTGSKKQSVWFTPFVRANLCPVCGVVCVCITTGIPGDCCLCSSVCLDVPYRQRRRWQVLCPKDSVERSVTRSHSDLLSYSPSDCLSLYSYLSVTAFICLTYTSFFHLVGAPTRPESSQRHFRHAGISPAASCSATRSPLVVLYITISVTNISPLYVYIRVLMPYHLSYWSRLGNLAQ